MAFHFPTWCTAVETSFATLQPLIAEAIRSTDTPLSAAFTKERPMSAIYSELSRTGGTVERARQSRRASLDSYNRGRAANPAGRSSSASGICSVAREATEAAEGAAAVEVPVLPSYEGMDSNPDLILDIDGMDSRSDVGVIAEALRTQMRQNIKGEALEGDGKRLALLFVLNDSVTSFQRIVETFASLGEIAARYALREAVKEPLKRLGQIKPLLADGPLKAGITAFEVLLLQYQTNLPPESPKAAAGGGRRVGGVRGGAAAGRRGVPARTAPAGVRDAIVPASDEATSSDDASCCERYCCCFAWLWADSAKSTDPRQQGLLQHQGSAAGDDPLNISYGAVVP